MGVDIVDSRAQGLIEEGLGKAEKGKKSKNQEMEKKEMWAA